MMSVVLVIDTAIICMGFKTFSHTVSLTKQSFLCGVVIPHPPETIVEMSPSQFL